MIRASNWHAYLVTPTDRARRPDEAAVALTLPFRRVNEGKRNIETLSDEGE